MSSKLLKQPWPFADEPPQFDEDCYCEDDCVLMGPHDTCEVEMSVVNFPTEPFCENLKRYLNSFYREMAEKGYTPEQQQRLLLETLKEMGISTVTPSASTGDGASPSRTSSPPVECPKCRTQLAFEGDVCGLCNPEVQP